MSRSPSSQVASTLRNLLVLFATAAALGMTAIAASQAPPHADPTTIEEITVIGRYPGPPLWRVSSGEHACGSSGTFTPVPKGLELGPAQCRARARSRGWGHRTRCESARERSTRSECSARCAPRAGSCVNPNGTTLAEHGAGRTFMHVTTACVRRHMPDADERREERAAGACRAAAAMAPRSTTPGSRRAPTSENSSTARCADRDAEEATSAWNGSQRTCSTSSRR